MSEQETHPALPVEVPTVKKTVRRGRVRKAEKPVQEDLILEPMPETPPVSPPTILSFESDTPKNLPAEAPLFEVLSKPRQVVLENQEVKEPVKEEPKQAPTPLKGPPYVLKSQQNKERFDKKPQHSPNLQPNRNFQKQNQDKRFQNDKPKLHHNAAKGPTHFSDSKKGQLELGRLSFQDSLKSLDSLQNLANTHFSSSIEPLDFDKLYELTLLQALEKAKALSVPISSTSSRRSVLNAFLTFALQNKQSIHVSGIVEIVNNHGDGLLVYSKDNYKKNPLGTFIPQVLMREFKIKRGQSVEAVAMPPGHDHSCLVAVKLLSIMQEPPENNLNRISFTELVPYYPLERILLETDNDVRWDNLAMRTFDLLTPIGFGQRGLIVAPPRTGKTVLMQSIANAISMNHPHVHLIILLVDERPEEVTDFKRNTKGEVISSTFDEDAQSHVHVAQMVIEKARCMVESGKHVVILLDSITRLARAYNTTMPSSGKILSGGMEANALQGPKRFFGSARNIENGGSLTILATALIDTNSKMDEVIFEEFKGTGNMEVHLDRALSDKRIFPAIHLERSGTRKEELLYHPDEMVKIYALRRAMKGVPSNEAMEMLIQRIKKTPTNAAFLLSLSR